MKLLNRLAILAVALVAVSAGTQAATRSVPPLFQENPNSRLAIQPRNDLDYRLPNNTEPISYDVTLTTRVHTGETAFTGKVIIHLRAVQDTATIVLHSRQQTILTATIANAATPTVTSALTFTYDETLEFLTLTSATGLVADAEYLVTIDYSAVLRSDNGGFYLSTYLDANGNTRYLATTQFESTDARHAFPCFDEPAKRATFNITINHDPSYNAISNMPVDEARTNAAVGVTAFQTTVNMPTYLVAFIVSDFVYTEGVLNDLKQSIHSRPGTKEDQEFALVSGMLIIQRLGEYYNMPFDIAKLDQAAIPDFAAGAMENWGLATYREEYLLYNRENSTVGTQTNIANIIAHEYAHMWFGNRVAIKWWTYLWLKEGFATVFSYQAADEAYPEWDIYQLFHASDLQSALNSDAAASSVPMTHYVQTPSEISGRYNYVSYAKAGRVLHMWQNALTDAVYQQGLRNYLQANQYSSAEEWQLFEAFQTAAKDMDYPIVAQMAEMWPTWTHQAGYPLLTVTRDYTTGRFTVKQTPYFNDNTVQSDKSWYVPFNYARQSSADFRDTEATHYLLNVPEVEVSDSVPAEEWVILNKQSTGYYRVTYDEQNWRLIIAGMNDNPYRINTLNRAQLMSDAYALSSTGRLSHDILLSLMEYLTLETEYAPWAMANTIITTFNRYLSGDADYAHFLDFVRALVTPVYSRLGVNDHSGDHHFAKVTRTIAINIACLAGEASCLEEMSSKLSNYISRGIAIEPNLQAQTFCNGLRQTGDTEFNFVFNMLMTSDDQAFRRTLISSLGCAQDRSHLDKFVKSSIDQDNALRTQERSTLLSAAYSRGETGLMASIDFLDANYVAYANLNAGFGGGNPLESDILGMANYVTNEEQKEKLLALVEKVKGSVSENLEANVQTRMNANFDWLSRNRDALMNWLSDRSNSGASVAASFVTILLAAIVGLTRW